MLPNGHVVVPVEHIDLLMAPPPPPGILYRHFDADRTLLYIGCTDTAKLRTRHRAHEARSRWWRFVRHVELEQTADRRAAALAETAAIRAEAPIFNVRSGVSSQARREADYVASRDNPASQLLPASAPRANGLAPVQIVQVHYSHASKPNQGDVVAPKSVESAAERAPLVTTEEAARALGIGERSLRRWAHEGFLRPALVTRGGRYRWDIDQVRRDLQQ